MTRVWLRQGDFLISLSPPSPFLDRILLKQSGKYIMESVAYILVLTLALGVLFFAIAFREPPRIEK